MVRGKCERVKKELLLAFAFAFLLPSVSFAANSYEIQLVVSKYVFGPGENISLTGSVINISSNSTANLTSFVSANVSVSIINSTNATIGSYTFLSSESGIFSSRSSFQTSAQAIAAPNASGTYTVLANSTIEGAAWVSRAAIVVANIRIDDILFQLPKINFYASENMSITARPVQRIGDSFAAVFNVSVNITMRHSNESLISSFACTTGASGTCTMNTSAPSSSGTYILEANNFVGFTNFRVVPFDVEVYMKDSSALTFKNMFTRGESGFVEVRVSFNSTTPTGVYNATGDVADVNGNNVLNLSSVLLNSTNGFLDKIAFTATSSLRVGFYTTKIQVRKEGGETINATTNFQVRDWSLTITKAAKNSGFEYGYTAFANTTLFFEAYPVERANGTILENLTSNFTITLKNSLGTVLSNSTVRYNASCGGKACYEFNLTVPAVVGDYTLSASLNSTEDYQTVDRTIKVADLTAAAQPSDSEGSLKELFGTNEFVYISLTSKNTTASTNASNAEVVGVTYENGTKLAYSEGNATDLNFSDSALKWAWNTTTRMLMLDPPKTGGIYLIEIYVNNKSAALTARIGINPFDVCSSAKGSSDTSTSDYWYQFRTSDTIYFHFKISEAQNAAGRAASGGNSSGFSSTYGRSSQCSFDTTKKRAINNATITVEKILNTQTNKVEKLNLSSSTCSSTDNSGGYICTVQADDGKWDGGRHAVTFSVLGDDKETYHRGVGFFEARAFYIYGYSSTWTNKATSSITLNINAYEAGSGWWNSASGLSGTAVVDSINYYGGVGEWIWPPLKYDYNVTGLNMTITNGVGSVTLASNRSATTKWAAGYYSAVVKVTVNDQIDYGEAWFSIRNWDAYAAPVEITGGSFETKNSINSKQNATLYVRISEAGDYSDSAGGKAIGNVSISVKKLIDYSQSPPRELTASNFTSNVIIVNATSPWYSSASTSTHGKYLINISPVGGVWEPGYYSAILDINNTEGGYGWFNVISFYISTQPTNANGSGYVYNNKGNSPVYFNLTTTKSQKSSYSASDYVNATITELAVRLWDQTTQTQKEFKYPADINVTPLLVNGSGILNVSYLGGNWPSGYYYGEIKMRETAENAFSKGWIWFSVQPFRVSSSVNSYNVGTKENATMSLSILEPDYSSNAFINGNYTITSVQETSWTGGAYRITNLNYTLPYGNTTNVFASSFRNSTTLTINPPSGKWKPGYKSGTIIIKDNATNDTQTAWFWFRATSFVDSTSRTSNTNIGPNNNVTVNITLTAPAGGFATGNLSSAFYWGWPSRAQYRFVIGSCDSQGSASCFINKSAIVTIVPPSGGWNEGYNYLYFEYVESDDATAKIESYNGVYFYVRQPLTGYMHTVNDGANWQNSFGQRENVTMYLYSLQNLTSGIISVNVTNVQAAKTTSNCWSESCRVYQNVTFEVMNFTSNSFRNAARKNITSSGYVRLNASGGVWDNGEYAVKIFVTDQNTGDTGILKDVTFRVIDKTAPSITITAPLSEQAINATSILFTGTTTETSVCYIIIYDYGSYNNYYCSSNGTAPSACNATKYNAANSSASFYSYASKWWSNTGTFVSTDSTSQSYNFSTQSINTTQQNYTVKFDCYDTDYNYATNATTFNLIGRGTLAASNATTNATNMNVSISVPANTTHVVTSLNMSLNFSVINGTPSACWYRLNNGTNTTIFGCANVTFSAEPGSNNITVYANSSSGSTASASRLFTVTVFRSEVSIQSPANTTYATTNITLNFTWTGNITSCAYILNSGSPFSIPCSNTTFSASSGQNSVRVNVSNSTGSNLSALVQFTVNSTNLTVTIDKPANTTLTSANVSLNFTVTGGSPSACWYGLSGGNNTTISGCGNTTFTTTDGAKNITVYANNSAGTVFNSSVRYFTLDTALPNVTFVAPTPSDGAVLNVNHTFINLTVNEAVNFIRLEFNGTNYTMTNGTQDTFSLSWFRNQTNTTTQAGLTLGNYTYKIYANDTAGNMGVSSSRSLRINVTS